MTIFIIFYQLLTRRGHMKGEAIWRILTNVERLLQETDVETVCRTEESLTAHRWQQWTLLTTSAVSPEPYACAKRYYLCNLEDEYCSDRRWPLFHERYKDRGVSLRIVCLVEVSIECGKTKTKESVWPQQTQKTQIIMDKYSYAFVSSSSPLQPALFDMQHWKKLRHFSFLVRGEKLF